MSKKRRTRDKANHRPPKIRYTMQAHRFFQITIAPLNKKYKQYMAVGLYDEAIQVYERLVEAHKQHRLYLHNKAKIILSK